MQPGEFLTFPTKTTIQIREPDLAKIHIEDIARSLSRQCRFNGYIDAEHYSVAQHSVIVSDLVSIECSGLADKDRWRFTLAGFLHDAAEAYLHDWIGPLKNLPELAFVKELDGMWTNAIEQRFGLPVGICENRVVKDADRAVFVAEDMDLRGLDGYAPRRSKIERIDPLSAGIAEKIFLARFRQLTDLVR